MASSETGMSTSNTDGSEYQIKEGAQVEALRLLSWRDRCLSELRWIDLGYTYDTDDEAKQRLEATNLLHLENAAVVNLYGLQFTDDVFKSLIKSSTTLEENKYTSTGFLHRKKETVSSSSRKSRGNKANEQHHVQLLDVVGSSERSRIQDCNSSERLACLPEELGCNELQAPELIDHWRGAFHFPSSQKMLRKFVLSGFPELQDIQFVSTEKILNGTKQAPDSETETTDFETETGDPPQKMNQGNKEKKRARKTESSKEQGKRKRRRLQKRAWLSPQASAAPWPILVRCSLIHGKASVRRSASSLCFPGSVVRELQVPLSVTFKSFFSAAFHSHAHFQLHCRSAGVILVPHEGLRWLRSLTPPVARGHGPEPKLRESQANR
ncbi:hypothetical protein NL676_003750 [Syzygium grande]|nr:hypothetical protein NL676_003750 [Syzygium grande]